MFFERNQIEIGIQQELWLNHASQGDPEQVAIHQNFAKNKRSHENLLTEVRWTRGCSGSYIQK